MRRMDAAVATLELLDRRRAAAHDRTLGQEMERDLIDLYIRDLDPDRDIDSGAAPQSSPWHMQLGFLAIGIGPYAVLAWLLWPRQ